MEEIGIVSVGAITAICYAVALIIKSTSMDNKWLPLICSILGGALGVVGKNVMPDFPAEGIITAISVGVTSGLAATGVNQIYKQLNKPQ